jgi:hypothetical protein
LIVEVISKLDARRRQVGSGEIRVPRETLETIETDIFPKPFLCLNLQAWPKAYLHKDRLLLNAREMGTKVLLRWIPDVELWCLIAFEFGLCGARPYWY